MPKTTKERVTRGKTVLSKSLAMEATEISVTPKQIINEAKQQIFAKQKFNMIHNDHRNDPFQFYPNSLPGSSSIPSSEPLSQETFQFAKAIWKNASTSSLNNSNSSSSPLPSQIALYVFFLLFFSLFSLFPYLSFPLFISFLSFTSPPLSLPSPSPPLFFSLLYSLFCLLPCYPLALLEKMTFTRFSSIGQVKGEERLFFLTFPFYLHPLPFTWPGFPHLPLFLPPFYPLPFLCISSRLPLRVYFYFPFS